MVNSQSVKHGLIGAFLTTAVGVGVLFGLDSNGTIDLSAVKTEIVDDFNHNAFVKAVHKGGNIFENLAADVEASALVVNKEEKGSGLPSSTFMEDITSERVQDLIVDLNQIDKSEQPSELLSKARATPMGAAFTFDDPKQLTSELLQETSLARYLQSSDGGATFEVHCSQESSDPVLKTLLADDLIHSGLRTPAPGEEATIYLSLDFDSGNLTIDESTTVDTTTLVLGCLMEAEEVYHAALHFIEGSFQFAIEAGVEDDFLAAVMNLEQKHVQEKYAEVRVLSLAPNLVWKEALPDGLVVPVIASAMQDFSTLDPLSNIPQAARPFIGGPALRDIYAKIVASDFGYGDRTIDVYISKDNTVAASMNNLVQLQLMVALLHTGTFVWQQGIGLFDGIMEPSLSGGVLISVVFPDVDACLGSEEDTADAYDAIVSASSPGDARDALESYSSWLKTYRASGSLTGIASAFADTQCMSSTTWI